MDKYDEKAAKVTLAVATIFQMSLGKPSEENAEEVVAAALRESATEAWSEAEGLTPSAWAWLKEKFREKQFALRSTTRGKGA